MINSLNTISKADLVTELAQLERRLKNLEDLLSGKPISTARIKDAAITNAKIADLSADKITTGTLAVSVAIYIRNSGDTANQGVIGYQSGGF